jgi:SAM-dependent methyltransferase
VNLGDIKKYWRKAGEGLTVSAKAIPTSKDYYLGRLEEENISRRLNRSSAALEIGCGDASHTIRYAGRVKKLSCLDISEPLVRVARRRISSCGIRNIELNIGSALDIDKIYRGRKFSCVISQRLLINLSSWSNQKEVIRKIHDLLLPGGLLLLTEAFEDGRGNINSLRKKCGLGMLEKARYNRFLLRKEFESFVRRYFRIEDTSHYGAYIFFSRVFHPLAVYPGSPKYDSKLNEAAMNISRLMEAREFEKYSYQLFYCLAKK